MLRNHLSKFTFLMEKPKIVIIGGGISGISAAKKLLQSGYNNICLLEAKDKLGGRICTVKYGEKYLDLGAQWIHGKGCNPLYQLAQQNDLVEDDSDSDSDEEKINVFYTQKGELIPHKLAQETCHILDEILEDANKFSREGVSVPNFCHDSVGVFARYAFDKYLKSCQNDEHIQKLKEGLFNWRVLYEKSDNASKSLDELSLFAWGEYLEHDGNQDVVLKYGFQPILDILLKDTPERCIQLNAEVIQINWMTSDENTSNNSSRTSPSTSKMPTPLEVTLKSGEIIHTDYVILTCSLGVLKTQARSLFRPMLPANKMAAIENMTFGVVNKIFLEFDQPFWDKDCTGIQLVWLDEPFTLESLSQDHVRQYGQWYRAIHSFDTVDFHPNLLCGWISGDEALVMEQLPEQRVVDVCLELLQKFTGSKNISRPIKITRTTWWTDPFIQGSYSYIKAGYSSNMCDVLAQPLPSEQDPRLLFAGEATNRTYFSTTHGAYLSGEREADRFIAHHKQCQTSKL